MLFEEVLKFEEDPDEVWRRVSAIRAIPDYWHGTKSLEVVRERENVAYVKMRFAFGGSGEAEIVTDEDRRTVTIHYTAGPFTGDQVISATDTSIAARWDVRFNGVFRIASRWNEGHFKSGTRHALERLANKSSSDKS